MITSKWLSIKANFLRYRRKIQCSKCMRTFVLYRSYKNIFLTFNRALNFAIIRDCSPENKSWSQRLPAFEHTALALPKTAFLTEGGAKSGALNALIKFHDPDLSKIFAAWPNLPEHVKAATLKMVKDATKRLFTARNLVP